MTEPTETPIFLFGTLRVPQLSTIVFGEEIPATPARVSGYEVRCARDGDWPMLVASDGGIAEGLCVMLPPKALARADYYEAVFGYARASVEIEAGGKVRRADAWMLAPSDETAEASGAPWSLAAWRPDHLEFSCVAAADIMAFHGLYPVEDTAARLPMIRSRAQARLNARAGGPTDLRRPTRPGDVEVRARRIPYAKFFSVEEYDLRHARFGGGMSAEITRAAFVSADAVTVLPYDPVRDRVLLIEQFRPGPLARGDAELWSLEAIAGRIDGGETPEGAARREAREEAGIEIADLVPLADYYPTPGAKAEFLYSFLALADLPETDTRIGGLDTEHEDIRTHVLPFERLMALVASGEVNNAPLLISALCLGERRESLRAGTGQGIGAR